MSSTQALCPVSRNGKKQPTFTVTWLIASTPSEIASDGCAFHLRRKISFSRRTNKTNLKCETHTINPTECLQLKRSAPSVVTLWEEATYLYSDMAHCLNLV